MRYRLFIGLCTGCLHDEALNLFNFLLFVSASGHFAECGSGCGTFNSQVYA